MQAEWARANRRDGPLRVAIIDLDVHQGNGTAQIFEEDATVFTLSLHGAKNFPFRKARSDLDVELPDACADQAYLMALRDALVALEGRFAPQMLFYLAGADCHEGDRLGRLKLSFDGMVARDRCVFEWANRRRLPLAFAMAGGYGKDPSTTIQCQINTFSVALDYAQARERAGDWQNQVLG
jgi:acetoin utilization deacetylase AcuC-like enzyme